MLRMDIGARAPVVAKKIADYAIAAASATGARPRGQARAGQRLCPPASADSPQVPACAAAAGSRRRQNPATNSASRPAAIASRRPAMSSW